ARSERACEGVGGGMGMAEGIGDRGFVDNGSRCANDVALDGIIAAWFRERTCADVMALFDQADVVAGPVLNIRDIVDDPQYRARDNIVSVPDDDFGSVRMQGVVPKFADTPREGRPSGPAPRAANHPL